MADDSKCLKCGVPLTSDARDGVCPKCLLGQALEGPAPDESASISGVQSAVPFVAPLVEGPGTVIGRYTLLQMIGEGGFGVVYMAEQKEPVRRRVALKIISHLNAASMKP